MTLPKLDTHRFKPEKGLRLLVQVPDTDTQRLVDAVLAVTALRYGDYDSVTFRTSPGTQQFRSLGRGRNAATKRVVEVPCVELSFFLPDDEVTATKILEAIYSAHPYEEPVIFLITCLRTRHIRGLDEDNPNRFWNRQPEDWVPQEDR